MSFQDIEEEVAVFVLLEEDAVTDIKFLINVEAPHPGKQYHNKMIMDLSQKCYRTYLEERCTKETYLGDPL